MKYVDMFLWQVGYELDIVENIQKGSSEEKMKAAAVDLGICGDNDSYQEVVRKIKVRWGIN